MLKAVEKLRLQFQKVSGRSITNKKERYDYFRLSNPIFRYVHKLLKDKKGIDLGCSKGDYLTILGQKYIGVDISYQDLMIAKQRGCIVLMADLNLGLPFKKRSVEAIFMSHVLEHIENPVALLREANRVLKEEGILVVGLPIEGGLYTLKNDYFGCENNPRGHLYSFSVRNLEVLLRRTGFGDINALYFQIVKIRWRPSLARLHDLLQRFPCKVLL